MRKLGFRLVILAFIASLFGITGCEKVPPVHRGKILQPDGYEPEILKPGRYWTGLRGEIILVETATNTMTERMKVVMSDKLNLKFNVRFRARIEGNDKVLNTMFDDITPKNDKVTLRQVYNVYGRMVVRNTAREVLSKYSVEDVHANYTRISKEMKKKLLPRINKTPLQLSDALLGDIEYPKVVTEAIEAAKKKDLEIAKAEAQAKIDLTKKKNERRLAEADYQVRMTKAKAIRDENRVIADGVSDDLIRFRQLEVAEKVAEQAGQGKGDSTVFVPISALGSQGMEYRMFQGK